MIYSVSIPFEVVSMWNGFSQLNLYFDNDLVSRAGQNATLEIKNWHPNVKDCSVVYKGFKDFNEFLQIKH